MSVWEYKGVPVAICRKGKILRGDIFASRCSYVMYSGEINVEQGDII